MSVIRIEDVVDTSVLKERSEELAKLKQTGACFYTDGGYRRTLPVPNASWAIHSWFYDEKKPTKVSRYKLNYPTKEGYQSAPENRSSIVNVSKIFNLSGLIHSPTATNNIAELNAIILALDIVLKTELKDTIKNLSILSDSKYCLDNILNIPKWKENKWNKKDGSPVLNLDYWKVIDQQLLLIQEIDDIEVNFAYVPGHIDHGNLIADGMCTLAMAQGIEVDEFCDEIWYNSNDIDINAMMVEQRYIHFPGLLEEYQDYAYMFSFADSTIPVSSLGCRLSDIGVSILKITEPKYVKDLKTIHRNCEKIEDVIQPVPMVVDLKNFLSNRFNFFLRNDLITSLPQVIDINKATINDPIDELPVVQVITPARNSFKLLDEFQKGVSILKELEAEEASDYVCKTDITDYFYKANETDPNGKLEFLVKTEESITVPVNHWSDGKIKEANIILTLGLDTPKRRVLFNLANEKPTISAITWELGEFSFRYGLMVETETSMGFWFSPYANTHLLLEE